MRSRNGRAFAAAALIVGAAGLASVVHHAGETNHRGFVSSAQAQPAPIRRLIDWLRGLTMPAGIVRAEGRIEATQVDVSSKYAGEVVDVAVQEGDTGEGDQGSGCQVLWEDDERIFCRGSRLAEDGSQSAVLIVVPVAAHPSRSSLDRLAHEHGLKERLDGAWAVRPMEIVRDGGHTMLVLEDVGDFEALERLLYAPMEVGSFLRLAFSVAMAVGKVHQRGLVHKDIKPPNILLNRKAGEVKLTGFGIASRLRRERQAPDPPETIAGTLAYMAPEQTRRMNGSIDSRSDLYTLGAARLPIRP